MALSHKVDGGRALEELERRAFDLLVIGGGIVGGGIAAAAARTGRSVINYAEIVALSHKVGRVAGAEVSVDGNLLALRARAVVNAAGPWVDRVRRLEDPARDALCG